MERNAFIVLVLLFFIVLDSSNASLVLNFRKLVGVTPKDSSTATHNSPLPSPVSTGKGSNSTPIDADKSVKERPKDPQVTNNSSYATTNGSNNNNKMGSANPPTNKRTDKGKSPEGKEKGDYNSQLGTNGSCEGSTRSCRIEKTMIACIQTSENESKDVVLLVQNGGEKTLIVSITIPNSLDNALPPLEIPIHQTKKINIPVTMGKSPKIILNAGNRDCEIHMVPPASGKNFFHQLSFYSKQVTPIYGAYFLFLVALIFGGTWACCKLRKRSMLGGVPYQELEMGLQESAAVVNVDSAEGWDQDWDDDWDEDKAVKSPGGRHVGSISANGLTSRSSKRDGWEVDWED